MARRLILDTGVLVAQERGRALDAIAADDDVAIATVTLGELWTGVHLADDEQRAARRRAFVEGIRDRVPLLPYDEEVAAAHGILLAHVHSAGKPRGAHDLIIAATAVATRRTLVTTDLSARFSALPEVRVLEL